ncbi:hypothetical protein LPW26_17815 [Rhodopseudomonas sp. HC1]|uniref:hypothetical protein n=1 Tax=Rhodopseudomonas infernalis TaxID=2897386 RepID=UPI001EE8E2F0|nr:hypothetical protein [Rhodopseudomonas infernalis]MCG6206509.1 hypothetical protein [Rhodopseudomonas infernalis]
MRSIRDWFLSQAAGLAEHSCPMAIVVSTAAASLCGKRFAAGVSLNMADSLRVDRGAMWAQGDLALSSLRRQWR